MKRIVTVLFASMALIACKKEDATGSMKVKMTDAPAAYAQVNVEIERVEVHYSDGGWTTLSTNAGVYNLLDFQNGLDTVIADKTELRAGKVSQMRLILGGNNSLMLADSSMVALGMSSQYETGLKLNLNAEIEANKETYILFDFDAFSSIVIQGNGAYKLKPQLKLVSVINI